MEINRKTFLIYSVFLPIYHAYGISFLVFHFSLIPATLCGRRDKSRLYHVLWLR
jgi:hypothetical protein